MIRDRARSCRGKISPQTMFLAAGVILLVAALVFLWAHRRGEEKKEEVIGKVGYQSKFTLGRHEGINLPVADQAAPAESSPDTTVEVPLEWGKDIAGAGKKLDERYAAIGGKLNKPTETMTYDQTVTLKVDRELEYRSLVQAVLEGQQAGFLKFRIACLKTGGQDTVGYLTLELPDEPPAGKNVLLFRLYKDVTGIRYVFGISKVKEYATLNQATQVMKNTAGKGSDKLLVLQPSLNISVQNVVEALNAATYAGFTRITLARAKVE